MKLTRIKLISKPDYFYDLVFEEIRKKQGKQTKIRERGIQELVDEAISDKPLMSVSGDINKNITNPIRRNLDSLMLNLKRSLLTYIRKL